MSRRHRLIQLFTLYFLSIVLIFFLTPIPKEYPSISYYTFVESLKNKEILREIVYKKKQENNKKSSDNILNKIRKLFQKIF